DLVVTNFGSGSLSIFRQTAGGFELTQSPMADASPRGLAIADVDGDDALDLVTVGQTSGMVRLLFGDGSGDFARPLAFGAGAGARDLVAADVDNAGLPDVVVALRTQNRIAVLPAIGGGLGPSTLLPTLPGPIAVAVGDVDDD